VRRDLASAALLMTGSAGMFAIMTVVAKLSLAEVHFLQVMFFRNFAALIPIAFVLRRAGGLSALSTARPGRHVARSLIQLTGMAFGFAALVYLPTAEATAFGYAAPMFVALLAIPLLGERPGVARFVAVALGSLGVLLIAIGRGGFTEGLPWQGPVLAMLNALCAALVTIQVRTLAATEKVATIVAWQAITMSVATGLAMPLVWVDPSPAVWATLVAVGVCGGVAQTLSTMALARAEASAVGPFGYSGIVFGVLLAWLMFADVPTPGMLAGGVLIALAGVVVLRAGRA
jgi:drug/metabolite transporter (DMT)-like permease